jgi:hypothetical protein
VCVYIHVCVCVCVCVFVCFHLQLKQGDVGEPGNVGDAGPKGPPGDDAIGGTGLFDFISLACAALGSRCCFFVL